MVDLDGRRRSGPLSPSVETRMHTTLACLAREIPPVHYMLAAIPDEGRVPLSRYATHGTEELALHAAEALGEKHSACLLQNHGTITDGSTPEEAYSRTGTPEEMAELCCRASALGEPVLLDIDQIAETHAKLEHYGQPGTTR